MFTTAVILAAGKSTRMSPLSDYIPKPLIKVNGIPLIDGVLDKLKHIPNIYVTYGYKSDLLLPHIKDRVSGMINTTDKGNAWFLYNTIIKGIRDSIIVIPCDIIFDLDFDDLYTEYVVNGGESTLVPIRSDEKYEADFITHQKDAITSINREVKTDIMASGIQIVNLNDISYHTVPADDFYSVWKQLINKSKLQVSPVFAENFKAYDRLSQIT